MSDFSKYVEVHQSAHRINAAAAGELTHSLNVLLLVVVVALNNHIIFFKNLVNFFKKNSPPLDVTGDQRPLLWVDRYPLVTGAVSKLLAYLRNQHQNLETRYFFDSSDELRFPQ